MAETAVMAETAEKAAKVEKAVTIAGGLAQVAIRVTVVMVVMAETVE